MSFLLGVCANIFHILINVDILLLGVIIRIPSSFIPSFFFFCILASVSKSLILYRYYAAALPSILNVFSAQSYLILNSIIGGQALAAVSNKLNDTLGIVIIASISFVVGFWDLFKKNKHLLTEILLLWFSCYFFEQVTLCGYKFIHWYSIVKT